MKSPVRLLSQALWLAAVAVLAAEPAAAPAGRTALKPLFRDPVFDGAADPIVVWNAPAQRWWMFYTNRRANVPGLSGVAWVHGTRLGIAESADDGATWTYAGTAEIELPAEIGGREPTHWAPDIVTGADGVHHLFLTVVPGIFENWQHPRTIAHLTSADLRHWKYVAAPKLASDRVIDACVHRLPGGSWRMWYNNERDGKSIYYADSPDLATWTDRGRCLDIAGRCEGPFVFAWKGRAWMLVDTWKGLGVYRSDDFLQWTAQPEVLLATPGRGADDGVNGGHPGVVVSGDRAYCFYFTHPGRAGTISPRDKDSLDLRRSSIQVVELFEKDGRLTCDRDQPTVIQLRPPTAAAPADPATVAHLAALGRRDFRIHDPSSIVRCKDEYWIFGTGQGVRSFRSKDLQEWTPGPPVFTQSPPWVLETVPGNRNGLEFWAPDIIRIGDRYLLYYSVSTLGKNTSAIALATNRTLDPVDPAYRWIDAGIVVRSVATDKFNTIDPAVTLDPAGGLWMTFGSFWSGIKLVQLDPATGKRLAPDAPLIALAWKQQIEAPALYRHGDDWFLFVNWGQCCRGRDSTYNIRVGRSRTVTGPYLDREGQDLLKGGGTLLLETDGAFIGPGHASVFEADGRLWLACHFYDGTTPRGTPKLSIRPLGWDAAGWPAVGRNESAR